MLNKEILRSKLQDKINIIMGNKKITKQVLKFCSKESIIDPSLFLHLNNSSISIDSINDRELYQISFLFYKCLEYQDLNPNWYFTPEEIKEYTKNKIDIPVFELKYIKISESQLAISITEEFVRYIFENSLIMKKIISEPSNQKIASDLAEGNCIIESVTFSCDQNAFEILDDNTVRYNYTPLVCYKGYPELSGIYFNSMNNIKYQNHILASVYHGDTEKLDMALYYEVCSRQLPKYVINSLNVSDFAFKIVNRLNNDDESVLYKKIGTARNSVVNLNFFINTINDCFELTSDNYEYFYNVICSGINYIADIFPGCVSRSSPYMFWAYVLRVIRYSHTAENFFEILKISMNQFDDLEMTTIRNQRVPNAIWEKIDCFIKKR